MRRMPVRRTRQVQLGLSLSWSDSDSERVHGRVKFGRARPVSGSESAGGFPALSHRHWQAASAGAQLRLAVSEATRPGAAARGSGRGHQRPSLTPSHRQAVSHGHSRAEVALLPRLFWKNPRSHRKGATGMVRTGNQRLPVLCHCQLGQDGYLRPLACWSIRPGTAWQRPATRSVTSRAGLALVSGARFEEKGANISSSRFSINNKSIQ